MRKLLLAAALAASPILSPAFMHAAEAERAVTEQTTKTAPQHAEWTRLLQTYVIVSNDGLNRFDYAGLKDNAADRAALNTYIQTLAASEVSALSDNERFAALANLYNALTIGLIVENYPVKSIMRIRPTLISIGPWKKDIVTLEGERVSLDDIEHEMLRVEYDDPRVHYAVNCASIGCPNLQPKAWEAATLDADLEIVARAYVNHPRGVTIRRDGRLTVSTIYKWFREDFGGNEQGVINHLLQYAEPELAEAIRARPDIANHEYDWALNE